MEWKCPLLAGVLCCSPLLFVLGMHWAGHPSCACVPAALVHHISSISSSYRNAALFIPVGLGDDTYHFPANLQPV